MSMYVPECMRIFTCMRCMLMAEGVGSPGTGVADDCCCERSITWLFCSQLAILGSLLAMADVEERERGYRLTPSPILPHIPTSISAPACKQMVAQAPVTLPAASARVSIAVLNTLPKSDAGREELISAHNSRVTLQWGKSGRNPIREPGGSSWCRGHGAVLRKSSWFSHPVLSFNPEPACLGKAPSTVCEAPPTQPSMKKTNHRCVFRPTWGRRFRH